RCHPLTDAARAPQNQNLPYHRRYPVLWLPHPGHFIRLLPETVDNDPPRHRKPEPKKSNFPRQVAPRLG
ncbi:hypothetical protein, partial [Picosynechococcus sp. PCC 7002]|uniref:hypothetical protein n=1 Tax=Picosynechococcus sp. (strain ATCC 27264 / PCC 7002 / PR-6) TaxID=32049 RepID=UPI0030D99B18